MFSYLTNWVWGAGEETDTADREVEHSTREEAGQWVLITTGEEELTEKAKSGTESTSQESECDRESACSDGSWVITPAPTFRVTGTTDPAAHPMENLLIEHPTMSVYGQVRVGGEGGEREEEELEEEEEDEEAERERQRERQRREQAQARELVLLRNRERYQVALQLQLPTNSHQHSTPDPKTERGPLRVTRKATRRRNNNVKAGRGKQNLALKKCTFVAGRRRC